jgi:Ca2+-binding RTX toxin-like protein
MRMKEEPAAWHREEAMTTPLRDGAEFLVNTTTQSGQYQPTITALADGRFVVAWTDDSQTGSDASGFAVRAQIFAADGCKQGKEFLVNTTTQSGQYQPTITALADGRFVVAWTDDSQSGSDTSGSAVRAQLYAADGQMQGAEFLVNTTSTNPQSEPTITALADGRFLVAWTDWSGNDISGSGVRAQLFAADGQMQGAEFLVNTTTNYWQNQPTITELADGRFVVAWTDESRSGNDTSRTAVRAQLYAADGQKQGKEFLVNTTTIGDQDNPTITALADGRFVVAWRDESWSGNDTSVSSVRAQIYAADGQKQGAEFLVNTTTTSYQWEPTITALADGRFVVAWEDWSESGNDTSGAAVRAQIFAAGGQKQGGEFLVNTTTTSFQSVPTITALADGRFVVAWQDHSESGKDTSSYAVRAQIFDGRTAAIQLNGTPADDDFVGTIFADLIRGSFGNDRLRGRAGDDELAGQQDDDTLRGGGGNDRLLGGAGNDRLLGWVGSDRLGGGTGADTLIGGGGADRLRGGGGKDTFLYLSASDAGKGARRDRILDFVAGSDRIDLSSLDADSTVIGNQRFVFRGAAAFSAAGQLRYTQTLGLLEGETNGDGIADFRIDLAGRPALAAADFVL